MLDNNEKENDQSDEDLMLDELELPLDEQLADEENKLRVALIAILGYVPFPTLIGYLWNSRQGKNEYSSSKALVALYSDLLTFNLLVLPIILTHINNIPIDTEQTEMAITIISDIPINTETTALSITMFWVAYLRYILMPIGFSMVDRHGSEIKELFEDALGIVGLILEDLEVPDDYYDKVAFGSGSYDMDLSAFSPTVNSKST